MLNETALNKKTKAITRPRTRQTRCPECPGIQCHCLGRRHYLRLKTTDYGFCQAQTRPLSSITRAVFNKILRNLRLYLIKHTNTANIFPKVGKMLSTFQPVNWAWCFSWLKFYKTFLLERSPQNVRQLPFMTQKQRTRAHAIADDILCDLKGGKLNRVTTTRGWSSVDLSLNDSGSGKDYCGPVKNCVEAFDEWGREVKSNKRNRRCCKM